MMLKRLGIVLVMAAVLAGGLFMGGSSFLVSAVYASGPGTWTPTGSLHTGRLGHTATRLADGKVLAAGGKEQPTSTPMTSAELFDPVSATWASTGSLNVPRIWHTATLLPNGKVLVAGGLGVASSISAEIYDPVAGTWTSTAPLHNGRAFHTANLLADGRVLVAGGDSPVAEIYDPVADTWTLTAPLHNAREPFTATLLADGRVLVAGGMRTNVGPLLTSAELYDPATGTWTLTSSLATARADHTATLLADGRVLVAGGGLGYTEQYSASAELYDPATETWSATGSLATARDSHTATLLADGQVLVAGGNNGGSSATLASAELYDPVTGTWYSAGALAIPRDWHTATLLGNGQVLVAGGFGGQLGVMECELYAPVAAPTDYLGYLPANISPAANFDGAGGLSLVDPIAGGATISFDLKFSVHPQGNTTSYPRTITFGPELANSNVTINGGATVQHIFTGPTSSFTDKVTVVAPGTPGPYAVKILDINQSPDTDHGLATGTGIVVHFTVPQPCAQASTAINLTLAPSCIFYHAASTKFTAHLTTGAVPVAGKTINFSVDGTPAGSATTKADGRATLAFKPASLTVGDHTVVASFAGGGCDFHSSSQSATLGVKYRFLGFLPPLKANGTNIFDGRAIPVRIRLADANGAPVPHADAHVFFAALVRNTVQPLAYINANAGNTMLYFRAADQYIFNWDISRLPKGTYTIRVGLGESICADAHIATVIIKQPHH